MADYLIADDRAEWEHEQRTERDFETYARGKFAVGGGEPLSRHRL